MYLLKIIKKILGTVHVLVLTVLTPDLRVFNKCEYQLNVDVVDANDKTAKDDKMLYSIKNS